MASAAPVLEQDDPIAALLLKLRHRDDLGDHEADALRSAIGKIVTVPAGVTLIAPGQALTHSILLIDGLISRYKDLADGQRQITEVHVAGDFVDLHGFLLKRLGHHVGTLTPVRIAYVPHTALTRITEQHPHLARMLWLSTLMDSEIQRERILSIGRRSALARIAHLMCELYLRLEVVGQVAGPSFHCPITQLDLADATGLTSVHVNRMLRILRDDGLLSFRSATVTIHDLARLEEIAGFDRTYLLLANEPR